MDEFSTYYTLFNLPPSASQQDLKGAYKRLVKQWHPDRFANDPINLKIAEEKIKIINIAYEALKAHQEGSHFGLPTSGTSSHTTSVKTHRTSPREFYDQAKRLIKTGQYREAADELTHAIKLNSNYAAAYHLRGILFSALGFENRGSSDFRRASEYGLYLVDYDDEIIDLIRNHKDFRHLIYLLKKDTSKKSEKGCQERESNQSSSQASSKRKDNSSSKEAESSQVKEAGFTVNLELIEDFAQNAESVSAMAISHSKKLIVTGTRSGIIELWNYKRKRSFHILRGHTGAVTHLIFSPDDQILFSSGKDGTVQLWNLSDGSFIKKIDAHDYGAETFAIDYAAKSLVTIGTGDEVKTWDFREGKLLRRFRHPEASIFLLTVSSAGLFTICGTPDGSIYLTKTLQAGKIISIQAHNQPIEALAFSQHGQTLASGSSSGEVGLWQFPSGDRRQVCQAAQSGITALSFCHQNRLLCGADNQGRLMVWDVASGALLDTASAHSPGRVQVIAIADDVLLSAGADGCIRQWRLQIP